MKCLYWNIRGVANAPSRLSLKRLIKLHNPDYIFIAEPKLDFANFPTNWFHRLGFKPFSVNNVVHPSLWGFCNLDLCPNIIAESDQFLAFSFSFDNVLMAVAVVYASTNIIQRRELWKDLNDLQSAHNLPWSFFGDFNSIIGAHEHRGRNSPSKKPMAEFKDWSDSNHLVHFPTIGAKFTWSNKRDPPMTVERRLDRCLGNLLWIDSCSNLSVSTLAKVCSDHYPLLFEFHINCSRSINQFKFLSAWTVHDQCRNLIESTWSQEIIGCPMFVLSKKLQLLKRDLRGWNRNVFGNVTNNVKAAEDNLLSVQDRIQQEGISEVLKKQEMEAQTSLTKALVIEEHFWKGKARVKWQLEGDRNTGYFHRISKIKQKFRPISMLMNGETLLTDTKDIAENAMLTLLPSMEEIKAAVFSLNKDSAPGPDGFGAVFYQTYWDIIKGDVSKAVLQFFDSGWVLPGFNSNTIILIPKVSGANSLDQFRPIAVSNFKFKIISKIIADRLAAIMSSLVSTEQRGFIHGRHIHDCIGLASEAFNMLDSKAWCGNLAFKVDIAKAFDTLDWSFLLKVLHQFGFNNIFCDWISSILKSANLSININGALSGYFKCSRGVRQGDPLSPLLFCLAEEVLSRLLQNLVSSHKLDLIKGPNNSQVPSHILYADDVLIFCKGAMSVSRLNILAALSGFKLGSHHFSYLGVPIFKGKPRAAFLQPLADKIITKLSSWKGSLLSFAGRVELVKSTIQGMLTHSMSIYSWPISLIRRIEKAIKCFIWSGDSSKNKVVTVGWSSMCLPFNERGLGLRSIFKLNEASNLKLAWDLFSSTESWAVLMRQHVLRKNKVIKHHIFSSIWSSVRSEVSIVFANSLGCLGDGADISLWFDHWCGVPLSCSMADPESIIDQNVGSIIVDGKWDFSKAVTPIPPNLQLQISKCFIPIVNRHDTRVWIHSQFGDMSAKTAYEFKRTKGDQKEWWRWIWSKSIPPSKSSLVWRLLHRKVPTDEQWRRRNFAMASKCVLCSAAEETDQHLFFDCSYASYLWNWYQTMLNLPLPISGWSDLWSICRKSYAAKRKTVSIGAFISILNTIWMARNKVRFQNNFCSVFSSISYITAAVSLAGNSSVASSFVNMDDFMIIKKFNVAIRPPRAPNIVEVIWKPPPRGWIKINCDGAVISSGLSGCGGIGRNSDGVFLGAFASSLSGANSLTAELLGAILAIEFAFERNWKNIWLETDSTAVVKAFSSPLKVPWQIRNRWLNCIDIVSRWNFMVSHIFREGNSCADALANLGLSLSDYTCFSSIPSFLRTDFVKNRLGLPFFRFVTY
ncbi:uncharacterized protein LOC131614798 [Vicia villosa]|uniref:uncharacterized protein LOC131614798 n=1 Tax=Vicia villosa TaxID=3911 RepID=UPI00273C4C4B|nr:uncharacterized protein LOC131614798 [Vicia villosa]